MLTEITNEAIGLARGEPLDITANFYFSIVSSILLAIVAVVVTAAHRRAAARHVRPRRGGPRRRDRSRGGWRREAADDGRPSDAAEVRGALRVSRSLRPARHDRGDRRC